MQVLLFSTENAEASIRDGACKAAQNLNRTFTVCRKAAAHFFPENR
jgi:hypothetical protein